MSRKKGSRRYAVCITNKGNEASLERNKPSPLVRTDPGLLVRRDPWDGSAFGLWGGLGARSPQ